MAACGGAPGSEALRDGADTRQPEPSTAPAASGSAASALENPPGAQAGNCTEVAEGCLCGNEGEVVACQGRRYDFGDYVTCAGVRQCLHGTWGACVSTNFVRR